MRPAQRRIEETSAGTRVGGEPEIGDDQSRIADDAVLVQVQHDIRLRKEAGPHRLHREDTGRAGSGGDVARLVGGDGDRLLDEHVPAGGDRIEREATVLTVRRRDVDDLHLLVVVQRGVVLVHAGDAVPPGELVGAIDRS